MNSRDISPSRAGSTVISRPASPVAQSRPSDSAPKTGAAHNTLTRSNAPSPTSMKRCRSCDSWKPRGQWHKNQWKNNGRCIECVELEKERQTKKRERAKKAARIKGGKRAKENKAAEKSMQGGKHAASKTKRENPEEQASATAGADKELATSTHAMQPYSPTVVTFQQGVPSGYGQSLLNASHPGALGCVPLRISLS